MNSKKLLMLLPALAISSVNAEDHHNHHHHHHNHVHAAPTGIMKAHTHAAGEFMISYAAKRMDMHGMMKDSDSVSNADVRSSGGYMMAPTNMTMDMHMIGAMYGLNDDQTLAIMGQYMFNSMRIKTATTTFKTHSEGFGDTHVSIIDNLNRFGLEKWIVSYGLSLPTGNTGITDNTPMGTNVKLPYNMQMGSGTYDFIGSATYQDEINDQYSYGVQGRTTIRTGTNDEGYRLGNKYETTAWATRHVNDAFNISALLDVSYKGEINGRDHQLNPNMTPTADAHQTEGTVIKAGLAADYRLSNGYSIGARLDIPVHQNYSGYQLEQEKTFLLQLRKTF